MNPPDPSPWVTFARQISTSSAVNPSLVLCAIVAPLCLLLAYLTEPPFNYGLASLGAAPILMTLWQIVRFTIKDPDRLQNDRHVEEKMRIGHLIGVNEGGQNRELPIALTPTMIDNPNRRIGNE
jgi:hypothetical protein